jgi:hypothetical protein
VSDPVFTRIASLIGIVTYKEKNHMHSVIGVRATS